MMSYHIETGVSPPITLVYGIVSSPTLVPIVIPGIGGRIYVSHRVRSQDA
jgi:hypothetical protein